jgi:glycosyltransferase involved in cell wall biosynthesis
MNTPQLTVLMPVYNAEKFLREAIESILQQTFADFEFLIIDDGSTDNSVPIIQSYPDPRIRLLKNDQNLGISATLNKGIVAAASDIIARMDADDISHPSRLEKQFHYMQNNPDCALVSCWANVITEDKQFVRLERYRSEFYYFNLTFECWMYHPTIVFRRQPVIQVGMYSMPYSEDYDLFWKISTRFKIGNLEEPLVDYRLSPTSLNTVLRKKEYDIANEQNVLRNIRYYLGSGFTLSKECLEVLRHNFEPALQSGNVAAVLHSLNILNQVAAKMTELPNANRHPQSIERALYFKRRFILMNVAKALSKTKAILLLLRAGEGAFLQQLVSDFFRWRFQFIRKWLRNQVVSLIKSG